MYFLIPILNFIGLELVYLLHPSLLYLVGIVAVVLTGMFILRETGGRREQRLTISITAFLFLLAHYLMLIFLEGGFLIHSFIFLTNFALFVFL